MKNKLILSLILVIGTVGIAYIAHAATYIGSPSACNGSWSMCGNANSSNNNYAIGVSGDQGIWGNYGLSIPSGFASASVQIGVEGHHPKIGPICASNAFNFSISKNGGLSYGPTHTVTLGCSADNMTWVDVTVDFPKWTSSSFTNANFAVRASCS